MSEDTQNGNELPENMGVSEQVDSILDRARLARHAISRGEILRELSAMPVLSVVATVQQQLVQRDQESQVLAIEALGHVPKEDPDARAALLCLRDVLQNGSEPLILTALQVLGRLDPQGMEKDFIALTKHEAHRVRKSVAAALMAMETVASTRALITLSREDHGDVRLWGLHHLRQLAFSTNREVQALAAKRLAQQDPSTTTTAPIVLLARKHDDDVHNTLRKMLKSEVILEEAVEAAFELQDPSLYEYLWDANWNWEGDPALMERALKECHWDDPRDFKDLIEQALNSKNYIASEQAVALLQRRDSANVFKAAAALTQKETTEERHLGARILGRLGGPNGRFRAHAVPVLSKLLEDKNQTVISEAVRAIGSGDRESIEAAVEQLKSHPHAEVRRLVSFVLFGVDDHTSPEALVALSTAREGMVRLAATQALTSILNPPTGVGVAAQAPAADTGPGESSSSGGARDGYARASTLSFNDAEQDGYGNAQGSVRETATRRGLFGRIRPVYLFIVMALVVIASLIFGLLERLERRGIDERIAASSEEPIPDLSPEEMIDTKARGRMFGDRRAAQVISMLKRPIRKLLTDKSECWYMYFRMDIRDSTAIISRAKAPKKTGDVEWIALEYLSGLISGEVNGDQHEKAGRFLMSLTVRNPKLGSHLVERVLEDSNFYQADDLVRDMAAISPDFRRHLASHNVVSEFHPALRMLSDSARESMIHALDSGWTDQDEYTLSQYLRLIK